MASYASSPPCTTRIYGNVYIHTACVFAMYIYFMQPISKHMSIDTWYLRHCMAQRTKFRRERTSYSLFQRKSDPKCLSESRMLIFGLSMIILLILKTISVSIQIRLEMLVGIRNIDVLSFQQETYDDHSFDPDNQFGSDSYQTPKCVLEI